MSDACSHSSARAAEGAPQSKQQPSLILAGRTGGGNASLHVKPCNSLFPSYMVSQEDAARGIALDH